MRGCFNRKASALLAAILLLPISVGAQQDQKETALDWVKRMNTALRTLDFTGTFVIQRDDSLKAISIKHRIKNGRIEERLLAMDGPAREIVSGKDTTTCVLPHSKSVLVDDRGQNTGIGSLSAEDITQLHEHYEFHLSEQTHRVAGRLAKAIAISPRDDYRYGYRFWLDKDSGLPVRSEMSNSEGKAIERLLFTELNIKPGASELVEQSEPPADYKRVQKKEQIGPALRPIWDIQNIPPGYTLTSRSELLGDEDASNTEHWIFSDGLAAFSVYIEHQPTSKLSTQAIKIGAMSIYSKELTSNALVTVVGEVPMKTARNVADGISNRVIRAGP